MSKKSSTRKSPARPASKRAVVALAPKSVAAVAPVSGEVFITRQVHFNAAHRLHNPAKSAQWNDEHYGLCANPLWHGHNYVLEVTLAGVPDPETGYVMDLGELKRLLNEAVVDPCDHRNLNEQVEFLRGVNPSTENLVIAFWKQIEPRLSSARLHCVRLFETPRNYAEYYGPARTR